MPADTSAALQRAVFASVYASARQRRLRRLALGALLLKHMARGLWCLWPVYLALALAVALAPAGLAAVLWLVLGPGLAAWLWIYARAALREYRGQVLGRILQRRSLRRLMRS